MVKSTPASIKFTRLFEQLIHSLTSFVSSPWILVSFIKVIRVVQHCKKCFCKLQLSEWPDSVSPPAALIGSKLVQSRMQMSFLCCFLPSSHSNSQREKVILKQKTRKKRAELCNKKNVKCTSNSWPDANYCWKVC